GSGTGSTRACVRSFARCPSMGNAVGAMGIRSSPPLKPCRASGPAAWWMVASVPHRRPADTATTGDRNHPFVIFYLNAALRLLYPAQYPRIDLMPEFIWRIKDTATYPFI